MSDAILLRGGGEKPIHMWKKYDLVENVSYTWNRWNLVSSTIYKWEKWNSVNITKYTWNRYTIRNPSYTAWQSYVETKNQFNRGYYIWTSYIYNYAKSAFMGAGTFLGQLGSLSDVYSSEGMYAFTGDNTITTMPKMVKLGEFQYIDNYSYNYMYIKCTHYWATPDDSMTQISLPSNDISKGSLNGTVSSTSSTAYPNDGVSGSYWYTYTGSFTEPSKGSVSYGQVTSTSSSAYPSNGQSGSYWYVSAGSEVQYSKGSTQQPDVTSTSPTAYPENGHDGSYWYDNRTSNTTHSMGSYIEDIFSTDPSKYPANGISGSFWYVYQGQL